MLINTLYYKIIDFFYKIALNWQSRGRVRVPSSPPLKIRVHVKWAFLVFTKLHINSIFEWRFSPLFSRNSIQNVNKKKTLHLLKPLINNYERCISCYICFSYFLFFQRKTDIRKERNKSSKMDWLSSSFQFIPIDYLYCLRHFFLALLV